MVMSSSSPILSILPTYALRRQVNVRQVLVGNMLYSINEDIATGAASSMYWDGENFAFDGWEQTW